jgi:hypothetical protein
MGLALKKDIVVLLGRDPCKQGRPNEEKGEWYEFPTHQRPLKIDSILCIFPFDFPKINTPEQIYQIYHLSTYHMAEGS